MPDELVGFSHTACTAGARQLEEWRGVRDISKGLAIATVVLQQDKKCNPGTELVS